MKFVAIPILILLLMTQTFSKWFVVLSFNLNRDYISKKLCENQYKPKMNCKGHCVLMKKIQQQEKEEQNRPTSVKLDTNTTVLSSRSFFATALAPIVTLSIHTAIEVGSEKPIDRTIAIFHPPSA